MRIVMTNFKFCERYISWLTVELIIFMRIVITNYTIFIHMVSKFSFEFNRKISTVCFTIHGVRGEYCYQLTTHVLHQNSGRKM